jgi:TfoX/Sxy family transcriptional regulator of competence genes
MTVHEGGVPMTMPDFRKSPPELVARFAAITAGLPETEPRQMFGYPSLFVGGNLVTGLHKEAWFVRVAEADRTSLLQLPGAGAFEPMPGRPMRGYVVLPPSVVADDAAIRGWVERAITFGRSLPRKPSKAAKGR